MNGVVVEDGIEVHERFTEKLAIESLTPSFLFFSKNFTKSRLQLTLQRTLSLAFAVTGLVITAPLMVLIATAIKLDSKGPVFFVQERTGLRGRTFRLVKFRTMRPLQFDETEGELWSRNSEARITRVGRVLRKLRLDELPQFINILRGDMDLIGPRPEIAENVKTMTEQIPYYSLRMVVRPGITGWAQIKHGYSVSHEDVTEKMRYDLYYVKHMSLWFDLRILVDTVKIVLLGRGSEMREFLPTDVPKAEDTGPPVMRVLATKETTGRGQV
jgi:lipopolysaccharide/colanic/teichoic acid biosynthesis glycosyltransferase